MTEADNDGIDYINIVTNPGAALTVNRTIKVVIMTMVMVDRTQTFDFIDGVYTNRTSLVNYLFTLNCLIKLK